jgi:phosphohistidine swiveling domain-containing protein
MTDPDRTWVTSVARRHTPLFLSIAIAGQDRERIERATGLAMGYPSQRRQGLAYQFEQDELSAGRAAVAAEVAARGLQFFDEYSLRCRESCETLLRVARDDSGGLESYFDAAVSHGAHLLTVILVQFALEDFLEKFVADRAGVEEVGDLLTAIKVPTERTHEVLNLEGLLRLAAEVQSTVPDWADWVRADAAELLARVPGEHPAIWQRVEEFQAEFGWMGRMYYSGEPISAADVVLRLQTTLRHDCAQRLTQLEEDRRTQATEREQTIEALGGDDEARLLADLIGRYMHLRSYRLDVFFMAHEDRRAELERAGAELGLTHPDDVLYLDWRELLGALESDDAPDDLQERVNARRQGFEMLTLDGVTEWTSHALAGRSDDSPVDRSDRLTGVTANRGEYRGSVRTVLSDQAMLAMRDGEVLVTTMTTPSLMLAVEKSGAIVTDEGGMLCHAAIVSREFNIPCVIGTEHATRWLKSGDTVLVDASNAEVRLEPAA